MASPFGGKLAGNPYSSRRTPQLIGEVLGRAVAHIRPVPATHLPRPEYIPSQARKAAALRQMRSYRVYELLHWLNRQHFDGRGKFVLTDTHLKLMASLLNQSTVTLRRLLRQMIREGLFLHREMSKFPYVALVGRVEVTRRLSVCCDEAGVASPGEVSYRKEVLEWEDFSELQKFAASTFNGWLRVTRHEQKHLRWEDLEALWNRSRPTLDAWIEKADIKKRHNIARTLGPGPCPDDIYTWTEVYDGKTYVCWQRANTYVSHGVSRQARRGVCRHAAAELGVAHPDIRGEGMEIIRTNWPWVELTGEQKLRMRKRMGREIQEHPDQTHYRHIASFISYRNGKTYQAWMCEHVALDKRLHWSLEEGQIP